MCMIPECRVFHIRYKQDGPSYLKGQSLLSNKVIYILSPTQRDWQLQISVLTEQPVNSDKNKQAKSVLTLKVHSETKTNVGVTQQRAGAQNYRERAHNSI